jgi:tungstate transport system ATP-binding protein
MSAALEMHGVRKRYGEIIALAISELALGEGSVTAFVGPNGSGKTTLLETLAALARPDDGSVLFRGADVYKTRESARSTRRAVTMSFQKPVLLRGTVFDNVAYPLKIRGMKKAGTLEREVAAALDAVGLAGFEARAHNALSGGEAQRVSIARALAAKPEVLLLDEPTGSIGREFIPVLMKLMTTLAEERGVTVAFTTHHLGLALQYAGRVWSLFKGRLIRGTTENLFSATFRRGPDGPIAVLRAAIELALPEGTSIEGASYVSLQAEKLEVTAPTVAARNTFEGTLVALFLERDVVKATIDAGVRITALIPRESLQNGAPHVGSRVSVHVPDDAIEVLS